jgi:hypothetical protein
MSKKKKINIHNMNPHQVDEALEKRLKLGLPGGDMLVLSRAYMERRIRRCLREGSPYPILLYHGWKPGQRPLTAHHMWGEEAEVLQKYGLDVKVVSGHGWEKTIPLTKLPQDQQDLYIDVLNS